MFTIPLSYRTELGRKIFKVQKILNFEGKKCLYNAIVLTERGNVRKRRWGWEERKIEKQRGRERRKGK